jgi:hypothetical protein
MAVGMEEGICQEGNEAGEEVRSRKEMEAPRNCLERKSTIEMRSRNPEQP